MTRLLVLTPNPAVDVTYTVDDQRVGVTLRVPSTQRRPGGKGLNVTRTLSDLGRAALAVQPLGGVAGDWIELELSRAGIEFVAVPTLTETRSTIVVVDGRTHPTLYTEAGLPLSDDTWAALQDTVRAHAEPGGTVVISGSFPPDTTHEHVCQLVTAARTAGARVVVDTSGPALLAAAGARADVVKPNTDELLEATAAPDLQTGMRALLARGAGAVVVSRGHEGLVGLTSDGPYLVQPAVPGVAGNPTGAGDAATAGLVLALDAGHDLAEAMRLASVTGAAAVTAPTAGELDVASLPTLASRLPEANQPRVLQLQTAPSPHKAPP